MIDLTLVTIHGFWSSPATWERLNAVWYADRQLRGLRIHPFSYPSPKKPSLPLSATRIPDYDDIAQALVTWYMVQLAEESDVAIVTHSQGGLILQRFLARMLHEGRGRELARIRSIIMLACPNSGSEYLRSVRKIFGFGHHAQAGSLNVLNRQVADTQRTVLERIVNATGSDDHECRIPFHVYAGTSDKIVTAPSAQGAFPGAHSLSGNHSSILDPAAPGSCTAETVRYHLLADLAASAQATPPDGNAPESVGDLLTDARGTGGKASLTVHAKGREDVNIGGASTRQVQEQQVARELAILQSRQDELSSQLASLSARAQQLEAVTASRISAATASIMNEAKEASGHVRAETRLLLEEQEKRIEAVLSADRAERRRERDAFRAETRSIDQDRSSRTSVLESARTAVADSRALYNAIAASLPHERFAPGELARLADRLAVAEASVAADIAEAGFAQARELFLQLSELRAEVELRDAEWRAAHLTATSAVLELTAKIRHSSVVMVTDEDSGASAEMDVDYWSDGEFSSIKANAERLAARVDDGAAPPTLAELDDISAQSAASLSERLAHVVAKAQARLWASQVRVNVAKILVGVLEQTTGYDWTGDAAHADGDQRNAFYAKLGNADGSEIVVEVAPGEGGSTCVVTVMSYETASPDEFLRAARTRAIANALHEHGLSDVRTVEDDKPNPAFRDFGWIRQRQPAPPDPELT